MIDIMEKKDCPYCGSSNVVYNLRGQLICRDCGLIFEPIAPLPPPKHKKVKRAPVRVVKRKKAKVRTKAVRKAPKKKPRKKVKVKKKPKRKVKKKTKKKAVKKKTKKKAKKKPAKKGKKRKR